MSATPEQQRAYDNYRGATTEGTKQSVDPQALRQDFITLMNNFVVVDPTSVDVSHLGTLSFPQEMFYRILFSTTFHVHWSNYIPRAFGSGNTLVNSIRRDATGRYIINNDGFSEHTPYVFTNPTITLTSNSLTLTEGLVSATYKLTNPPVNVNGVQVWNHSLSVYGRQYANVYYVPFEV